MVQVRILVFKKKRENATIRAVISFKGHFPKLEIYNQCLNEVVKFK